MKPNILARALALALSFASAAALAQSAPAGAGSVGNFPVITVPPPPMTSVQNPPTPGADATLWSNGIPGPTNSSVTIPLGGGGNTNPPPPPPPVSCTPASYTQSAGASCPAGETVGGFPGGATTFPQTRTVSTTCPGGSYGGPVTTATVWSPSAATECLTPGSHIGPGQTCSHIANVSNILGHWCAQTSWNKPARTCGRLVTVCTWRAGSTMPAGLSSALYQYAWYGTVPVGYVACSTIPSPGVAWCPGS